MNNTFFAAALRKASLMSGKPGRLIMLAARLTSRLRKVDWTQVSATDVKSKFSILGRMIKAYGTGEYRQVPWKTLLLIVAAVIYFINPVDLLPDLIPILGFTDDFGILLWVYQSVSGDVDKFLAWERTHIQSI